MAITLEEGRLAFTFDSDAIKFDDEQGYYGKYFKKLQGGKGVDFIAFSSDAIQLIEVKDCRGQEKENLWRTVTGNSCIPKRVSGQNETDRDSLDVEVAKKVASTIACLYGAWTMEPRRHVLASSLVTVGMRMNDKRMQIPSNPPLLRIVLFLEGDFDFPQSRSKESIMQSLQESIQKQLFWLNCAVFVTDSDHCGMSANMGFTVVAT